MPALVLTNGPELVIADSVVVAGKTRQQLRNESGLGERSCAGACHVLPAKEQQVLSILPQCTPVQPPNSP